MLQQYLSFTVLKLLLRTFHDSFQMLQQYLPFTVLKLFKMTQMDLIIIIALQQYLPFTVLKPIDRNSYLITRFDVATVLTVYGIETFLSLFQFC